MEPVSNNGHPDSQPNHTIASWAVWPRWWEWLPLGLGGVSSWLLLSGAGRPGSLLLPMLVFIVVAVPTCIAMLSYGLVMKRLGSPQPWQENVARFMYATLVAASLVLASLWLVRWRWTESRARGARIVSLVESYKRRTGAFPKSLNEIPEAARLQPAIPDWSYQYDVDDTDFHLEFSEGDDSSANCVWHGNCPGQTGDWCCHH